MFICATVLYFDDIPVGYNLLKEEEGYLLKPATNREGNFAPLIRLVPTPKGWAIKGTTDAEVQAQAIKLVDLQLLANMPATLSVAS